MTSKRTGRGTVLFGLVVLLAGLGGAVVLYLLSLQRGEDAIRDLARAPVGCDTTLSFSDTGTFYVFIEHLGRLEEIDGDCDTTTDEYSRDPEDEPVVTITLVDEDGNQIELDRLDEEFTYSLDDSFAGTATRQFEIETTGDYVMTVESSDGDDFVVAVGRDPADLSDTMRIAALGVGSRGRRARSRARAVGRPSRQAGATPRHGVHRRNRVADQSSGADRASADGPAAHRTDARAATARPAATGDAGGPPGRVPAGRAVRARRPTRHRSDGATARVRSARDAVPAGRTELETGRARGSADRTRSVALA